jgi:hypothetical protein
MNRSNPPEWRLKDLSGPLASFDEAVSCIKDVLEEQVALRVGNAEIERSLEFSGELRLGREFPEEGRVIFWLYPSGSFSLFRDHFVSANRWSEDFGDYWSITIEQGGIRIYIGDSN